MNFEELVKELDNSMYNSSSTVKNIEFINKYDIDNRIKKQLIDSVDRTKNITIISSLINDIDIAIEIEAGIYEFSLVYTYTNNLSETIIQCIYNDKLNSILEYIDKKSPNYSKYIVNKIFKKQMLPQELAFAAPQEIKPDNWTKIIKKMELREYKKNNMAATDLYKCFKCGERRCKITQLQTRSADEPITNFITCLNCSHTFKV